MLMNDLPVIGSTVMRQGSWDHQGANVASRLKEMYGEKEMGLDNVDT